MIQKSKESMESLLARVQENKKRTLIKNALAVRDMMLAVEKNAGLSNSIYEPSNYKDSYGKPKVVQIKNAGREGDTELILNSLIPSTEVFTVLQKLVTPIDEMFVTRMGYYYVDESAHPGSPKVGIDIVAEQGTATISSGSGEGSEESEHADIQISRLEQPRKIITQRMVVTRNDLLSIESRSRSAIAPRIDLLQLVQKTARENIMRAEDQVNILGSGGTPGLLQSFADSDTTKSKLIALASGSVWTSSSKTGEQIVADIRMMVSEIRTTNRFRPTHIGVPTEILDVLANKFSTSTNSTPILEWLERSYNTAYQTKLKFYSTSAFNPGTSNHVDGNTGLGVVVMAHIAEEHMCFARSQDILLLPPRTEDGDIKQKMELRTAGYFNKHPLASVLLTGVSRST